MRSHSWIRLLERPKQAKKFLEKHDVTADESSSTQCPMAGVYERGNRPSVMTSAEHFLKMTLF